MFRNELLHALKMLQDGVRTRETMTASWAGAMGLTQFMPSEFYTLAYDLDGDGRKDIWGSVADALGSAANQLRAKGWVAEPELGLRGAAAQGRLLPRGRTGQRQAGARVGEARRRARGRRLPRPCAGPAGLRSDACRRPRPSVPGARELPGHQALQHVRPLRAVRRQPRRPHRRRRRLRDALGRRPAALRQGHRGDPGASCRGWATRSPRSTARPA